MAQPGEIFFDPKSTPPDASPGWDNPELPRFRIIHCQGEIREEDLPEIPAHLIIKPVRLSFWERIKLAYAAAKMILWHK